jgi:hypothetical protein
MRILAGIFFLVFLTISVHGSDVKKDKLKGYNVTKSPAESMSIDGQVYLQTFSLVNIAFFGVCKMRNGKVKSFNCFFFTYSGPRVIGKILRST